MKIFLPTFIFGISFAFATIIGFLLLKYFIDLKASKNFGVYIIYIIIIILLDIVMYKFRINPEIFKGISVGMFMGLFLIIKKY